MKTEIIWEKTDPKPLAGKTVALLLMESPDKKPYLSLGHWVPRLWEKSCFSEYSDYDEETGTYYTPEGWYEEVPENAGCEFSCVYISDAVIMWGDVNVPV